MLLRSGLVLAALTLSLPMAEACSLTPMGLSTVQLEGIVKYINKQYAGNFNASVSNVRAVSGSKFVVTFINARTGNVLAEHKYAVSIGADCSTVVKEVGP